jgi:hypothetical protein
MSSILNLQRLTPMANRGDLNNMLISTASAVCPTTIVLGAEFELA